MDERMLMTTDQAMQIIEQVNRRAGRVLRSTDAPGAEGVAVSKRSLAATSSGVMKVLNQFSTPLYSESPEMVLLAVH